MKPVIKNHVLKTVLVCAALAGFAAGCALVVALRAGVWFAKADPVPPEADVIFTFAGENARLTYSRELMARFPRAHWVLSDYHHFYTRILSREDYDMSRVSTLDSCPDTYQEVRGLARWLTDSAAMGRRVIVLVSSPYHMRRIELMVQNVFGKTPYDFYFCPVPIERYNLIREDLRFWWRSKLLREKVWSEFQKILVFWFFK
ncbi:MAG: YdcF family protein [Chitinispirillaceae bacterium]|jgi:uncharacterized SAM-binding protein YcdF (DUF218 family)|nr:YdcF family protein [Chitinispirillaceae bacterium]